MADNIENDQSKVEQPPQAETKVQEPATNVQSNPTPSPAAKPKKSHCCLWTIITVIVLYILFSMANFFFPVAGIIGSIVGVFDFGKNSESGVATTKTVTGTIDQNLIGFWDTGCLIPKAGDPWAEQHTFAISSNGIANHRRLSGESCAALKEDHNENYNISFPASGQINFIPTDNNVEDEPDIYDIYEVTTTTLKFGHGFCNCTSTGGRFGLTAADRIVQLNEFLVYKKK